MNQAYHISNQFVNILRTMFVSILQSVEDEDIINAMDFDDFDRRFEIKTNDTVEEVQAKRESGEYL